MSRRGSNEEVAGKGPGNTPKKFFWSKPATVPSKADSTPSNPEIVLAKPATTLSENPDPLYEHVFIVRQDLSEAQAKGLIEHFAAVVADNGGAIVEREYWGIKTMAYKIKNNRKGHYAFLKSNAPSAAIQEMERLMSLHDDVMRVLTVKIDKDAQGPAVHMNTRDNPKLRPTNFSTRPQTHEKRYKSKQPTATFLKVTPKQAIEEIHPIELSDNFAHDSSLLEALAELNDKARWANELVSDTNSYVRRTIEEIKARHAEV